MLIKLRGRKKRIRIGVIGIKSPELITFGDLGLFFFYICICIGQELINQQLFESEVK